MRLWPVPRWWLALALVSCARPAPAPAVAPDAGPVVAPRHVGVVVPPGVSAPVAAKKPTSYELHEVKRTDDYRWLREKGTSEVEAYLQAENAFTDAVLKPTEPLQQRLFDELVAHTKEDDTSVPAKDGDWLYWVRTSKGQEHPVWLRRRWPDGPDQVLLDLNPLRATEKYVGLCSWHVSDDGQLLAWAVDTTGFRVCNLRFKNLSTGAALADQLDDVGSVAWAADGETVFYTTLDSARRPSRLKRHRLGTPQRADLVLYEEKDERFDVDVSRTRSKAYLVLSLESHTTTELRVLDARTPLGKFRQVVPRVQDVRATLSHRKGFFVLTLNDTGRNQRVVQVPVATPDHTHFQQLLAASDEVPLEGVDVFDDYLVLVERRQGLRSLRAIEFATGAEQQFTFPEALSFAGPDENPEQGSTVYRYTYESLVTPPSVYQRDLKTGAVTLLKRDEVPGYDGAAFTQERLWATAADGTRVPISLVHRKGLAAGTAAPLLLEGYGAYGISTEPTFDANRLPMLERGAVLALAHVRGGGEFGKGWHDAGRLEHKATTFSDFIACADELVRLGRTSPDRLIATGGSAGGLLMGVVLNRRPELFKAVVAQVPFVDALNTMLDESLPLTVGEFEEWGNPKQPADDGRIASYSPYDNVRPRAYPDLLVTSSYNDSQVGYFEPAKWVAKLRVNQTGPGVILLKMDMEPAGHSGKSGRYEGLREEAFFETYLLTEWGLNP